MTRTRPESAFWKGVTDALPFTLVVSPFALVFGVLATEAGLKVWETMIFSIAVIAGAAQLTALQLMQENAPTVIVLISALAVNLRMAMYSASLTPYIGDAPLWKRALVAYFLVDQSYALSVAKYEQRPEWSLSERLQYFAGAVAPVVPLWYIMTLVGALIGTSMPESAALDFAVPITFIAIIAPMMRTAAHLLAALTAVTLSLALTWVPFNLGVILAASAAMIIGAETERQLRKRGLFE